MPGGYGSEWHRKHSCIHGTLILTERVEGRHEKEKRKGERQKNQLMTDVKTFTLWLKNNNKTE